MTILKTLKQTILTMGLVLVAFNANADKLDLSSGTMMVGGNASFQIQRNSISAIPSNAFRWNINLDMGYFVLDNLALKFNLGTGGAFTSPLSDTSVALRIGADYFFDLGSMLTPYVGIMPGIEWSNGPLGTASLWFFDLPFSAGILIGLNSHVALDVGARVDFAWGLSTGTPNDTQFGLQIGYVGVRAFF